MSENSSTFPADKATAPEQDDKFAPVTSPMPSGVPSIYFNGFDIRVGLGDIAVVLYRRGEPIAVLESSFTVTKSLTESLGTLIARFEHVTGNQLMTTQFIEGKLKEEFGDNQSED